DRTIVVERFRDELGDWRVVILTPFGGQVHAPWAHAIEATLAEESGFEVQTLWSDDGIALRFADTGELPPDDALFPDPEVVEDAVVGQLAHSALFAARFRENAGRALLLPKRRPGSRSPLWAQRQRAANLLAVASRYGSFPIVLETYRECLADVFDLPGLKEVLSAVRSREIRVVSVETREASPFARSLLFDYIAAYMYEGDAPLAERRAQALALDRSLLAELLGEDELRELLDADALLETELELQGLADSRRARTVDHVHDLLRRVGDLRADEVAMRATGDGEAWLLELEESRRACRVRIGGEERWIAIEDAGRFRDALGVSTPLGVPEVFLKPTEDALRGLVARYARTHAPFLASAPAVRWSIPQGLVERSLTALADDGLVIHGEFRPGGSEREWCDVEVLRVLRRRSLAKLRREVEPVSGSALARFLPAWHGVGSPAKGVERLREILVQLEGLAIPASVLEREILPVRVRDYQPRLLDELGAAGDITWVGRGAIGRGDGRVALYRREQLAKLAPRPVEPPDSELHHSMLDALRQRGALFFADIVGASGAHPREALDALWDLAWAGMVTNDTFAPVRAATWRHQPGSGGPRRGGLVPPEAAGRWSLTGIDEEPTVAPTVRAHATAQSLLERYGVLTREAVNAEGHAGGFAAMYPILKAMEEGGRVRRGYFVESLGGAQFALPGAVDRLRAAREPEDEPRVLVLAATDPANPYGAGLAWPKRDEAKRKPLARVAGAAVVIVDGEGVLYVERGGRGIVTLAGAEHELMVDAALTALVAHDPGGRRGLTIERVDGLPAAESPLAPALRSVGFVQGYKGFTYRAGEGAAARA
ncbi:MAG: Lhr family helicase, partial [Tepidiformaceae bacterium]